MIGEQAKKNFDIAAALVRAGQFEAARLVELLPSDRKVIEDKIKEHSGFCANRRDE